MRVHVVFNIKMSRLAQPETHNRTSVCSRLVIKVLNRGIAITTWFVYLFFCVNLKRIDQNRSTSFLRVINNTTIQDSTKQFYCHFVSQD